ncbi:MAG TPA: isochorismatase family protein [Candidatus Sulfotelmatobacter sp.]|nr:isochorismatase family protein [Candidatus Sulfotelmatobacter sp.]
MAIWDDVIPEAEQRMYEKGGMGRDRVGMGEKPAVVVVDMTYGFVDSAFPLGHSETGYPAVAAIRRLLDRARPLGVPVFYTLAKPAGAACERGLWKGGGAAAHPGMQDPKANQIVEEIAPRPGEPVVAKTWPSAFFGTSLVSYLIYHRVDTLVVTGMVTSGCVRGTAVDAFSHNYRVIVPQECVADRGQTSHKVALFEIHMKYGDVLPVDAVISELGAVCAAQRARSRVSVPV